MPKTRIETAHRVIVLAEHEQLTFGRARDCTVCLDPDDTGISRTAGAVQFEHGTWWIVNTSRTCPLSLVDDLGLRSVLAPLRRSAVQGPTQLIVNGTRGQHCLRIEVDTRHDVAGGAGTTTDKPSGTSTATGTRVLISSADRLAMVALFAGYLEDPPRYDPYPKSYAAAAARLGWRRNALIKRIEYLRKRLDAAGVPKMLGFSALTNLAEYAISRGMITRDDMRLLRPPGSGARDVAERLAGEPPDPRMRS